MSRKRQGFFKKPRPKLYLGEWLFVLDVKPAAVAREIGVTESYLSELIAGIEKINPSSALTFAISEFLGLTVNDLYRPPPSKAAIEAAGSPTPPQIAALGQLLDRINPRGRK